jgi:hypothetical protein
MADEGPGDCGGIGAEAFARDVRQLSSEAYRVLGRPDSSIDVVLELHRRAWGLLRQAPGPQMAGIHRWLLAVCRALAARLRRWAEEELESQVA